MYKNNLLKLLLILILSLKCYANDTGNSIKQEVHNSQNSTSKVKIDTEKEQLTETYKELVKNALKEMKEKTKEIDPNILDHIDKPPEFVISDDILKIEELSNKVKAEINARKMAIKQLIFEIADKINKRIDIEIRYENSKISLHKVHKKKIYTLRKHVDESNTSISNLALALEMVASIVKSIAQDVKAEKDKDIQLDKYVEHTAIVFELTNITIDLLNYFKHQGAKSLNELYKSEINSINDNQNENNFEIKKIKDKYKEKDDKMSETDNDAVKQYITLNKQLESAKKIWYLVKFNLGEKEKFINTMKNRIEELKTKRKLAERTLSSLSCILTAADAAKIIEEISKVVNVVTDVPLLKIENTMIEAVLKINTLTVEPKSMTKETKLKIEKFINDSNSEQMRFNIQHIPIESNIEQESEKNEEHKEYYKWENNND